MGLFNHFPYTNFHELNLDWILSKFREFTEKINLFSEKFEGGKKGQVLRKKTDSDLDFEWNDIETITGSLPKGGISGQILRKKTNSDYDAFWDDNNDYYLLLSDSYGDSRYGDGSWIKWFATSKNLDESKYSNLAYAGSSFTANNEEYQFVTQLKNFTGNRDKVTHIVLAGGLNDSSNLVTNSDYQQLLNTRIKEFYDYATAEYPNATIFLGYIGNGIDTAELIAGRILTYRRICKYLYYLYASFYGYKIMYGIENALSINSKMISSDGVHPSTNGAIEIGKGIANIIDGLGYIATEYPYTIATVPHGDFQITGNAVQRSISGDYSTIRINNITIDNAVGLGNITTYTEIPIAYIDDRFLFNQDINIPVSIRLDGYNNITYQTVKGCLIFRNNILFLIISELDSTGYITYTPAAYSKMHISNNGSSIDFTFKSDVIA